MKTCRAKNVRNRMIFWRFLTLLRSTKARLDLACRGWSETSFNSAENSRV
jgi:hypothetical protein